MADETTTELPIGAPALTDAFDFVDLQTDPLNPIDRQSTFEDLLDLFQPALVHNSLSGLTLGDPHTQYPLSAGRSGGQQIIGGPDIGDHLVLQGSDHASVAGTVKVIDFLSVYQKGNLDDALVNISANGGNGLIGVTTGGGTAFSASSTGVQVNRTFYLGSAGVQTYGEIRTGSTSWGASADRVRFWAFDHAAGDARLLIQSESGSSIMIGGNQIRANQFWSNVATGTAPLLVTSTTVVTNFNADYLDGQHGSYYTNASNIVSGTLGLARGGTGIDTSGVGKGMLLVGVSAGVWAMQTAGSNGDRLVADPAATNGVSWQPRIWTGSAGAALYFPKKYEIFEPTDGLYRLRYNGTLWQPLDDSGMPFGYLHSGVEPQEIYSAPQYQWVPTGTNNEYALLNADGSAVSLSKPSTVYIGGAVATEGVQNSLAAATWAWGAYGGNPTLIVRSHGSGDPDTVAYGYIRGDRLSWITGAGVASAMIGSNHFMLNVGGAGGTASMFCKARIPPAPPWTFYAVVRPSVITNITGAASQCGISISDNTRLISLSVAHGTGAIYISKYNTTTSYNSDLVSALAAPLSKHYHFAIRDDGTNISFFVGSYISDRFWMRNFFQEARATFLTNIATSPRVGLSVGSVSQAAGAWYPYAELVAG